MLRIKKFILDDFLRKSINQSETGLGGKKLSVELYAWVAIVYLLADN